MVEVLKKVKQYRIQCQKCHSLLKYDEYDELGKKEFEQAEMEAKVEQARNHHLLRLPTSGQLYIWCPVCDNKVITTELFGYRSYPKGEVFGN